MSATRKVFALVLVIGLVAMNGIASAGTPEALEGCSALKDSVTKADGSILAVGTTRGSCDVSTAGPGAGDLTLVQLRPDGSLDPSFSNGGVKVLDGTTPIIPRRPLLAGGGRVVVPLENSLIRVNDDGTLDESFGAGGLLIPDVFERPRVGAVGVQSDGRIVVAKGLKLARFKENGQPDDTFGGDGVVDVTSLEGGTLGDITFDSAGNILAGGYAGNDPESYGYAGSVAVRFTPDGTQDLTFGPDGTGVGTNGPSGNIYGGFQRIFVGSDGKIRLYDSGETGGYFRYNSVSVLSPDGLPLTPSYGLAGGGDAFAETPQGDHAATWGPSRGDFESFLIIGPGGYDGKFAVFAPTPGRSMAFGINYSAFDDSFVAAGRSTLGECFYACSSSLMTVAKVDAKTFEPDPDFGVGGVALIPLNDCANGSGPARPGSMTPWIPCRLNRPKLSARLKIRNGGGRKPALVATASLEGVAERPYFVGQRIDVRIPDRLRINRRAKKLSFGSANPADRESTSVTLKGRKLTIEVNPEGYYDPYEGLYGPANGPMEFRFGLRAGAIKPIGRKLRKKKLNFPIRGSYLPKGSEASSRFYAPNSRTKVLRVRPVTGRVPRAGR